MPDRPKTIVIQCPACGSRLKARENLIGKRTECPKCKRPITIPPPGESAEQATGQSAEGMSPKQQTVTRPAPPSAAEREVASTARPGAEVPPDQGEGVTGVRWNFLVSLGWLFLGWSLARLAPRAALGPACFESLLNVLPLMITLGLIGWNLWASLRILGRTGRAVAALPLTSLQVLLFTLLFYQVACHRGADHFVWDRVPGFFDWVALLVVHGVRAADVMDAIEAYGLNLAVCSFSHGREATVPALSKALGDEGGDVRQAAAEALDQIGAAAKAAVPAKESKTERKRPTSAQFGGSGVEANRPRR